MRPMLLVVLAAALALSLGACSSTCSKLEDLQSTLSSKVKNCALTVGQMKYKSGDACTTAWDQCSSDDQKKVNDWLDCIDNLDDCAAGQEAAWQQKVVACDAKLNGITGCYLAN